jgi:ATPase family AAA domain-containing protein 3A/B
MVEFPLPGEDERNRLVRLYFEKYVLQPALEGGGGGRKIGIEEMDYSKLCSEIAVLADGMSGREIAKLGVAWQAAGYASEEGMLSRNMIMERVKVAVRSHSQKIRFVRAKKSGI